LAKKYDYRTEVSEVDRIITLGRKHDTNKVQLSRLRPGFRLAKQEVKGEILPFPAL